MMATEEFYEAGARPRRRAAGLPLPRAGRPRPGPAEPLRRLAPPTGGGSRRAVRGRRRGGGAAAGGDRRGLSAAGGRHPRARALRRAGGRLAPDGAGTRRRRRGRSPPPRSWAIRWSSRRWRPSWSTRATSARCGSTCATPEELTQALAEIEAAVTAAGHRVEGWLLQELVRGGHEVIFGISTDPRFGPLLMFGLGGKYVEVFRDVRFGVPPLTPGEAAEMVRGIRGLPLLEGVRGEAGRRPRRCSKRSCCGSRSSRSATPRSRSSTSTRSWRRRTGAAPRRWTCGSASAAEAPCRAPVTSAALRRGSMPELPDIERLPRAPWRRASLGEPLEQVRLKSPFLLRSVTPPLERGRGPPRHRAAPPGQAHRLRSRAASCSSSST